MLAAELSPAVVSFQKKQSKFQLDDLWFMVGSRCNLSCIHCYVASSPENDSLEQLTLEEVKAFLKEGTEYGLRHAYFTGGEPFLNTEIMSMIESALEAAEITILTNATSPIHRYLEILLALHHRRPGRLTLRVSMDHYEESRHDAIRGEGNFRRTVEHAAWMAKAGLPLILTVTPEVFRGNPVSPDHAVELFKRLFRRVDAEIQVKILPAVLEMGSQMNRLDHPKEYPLLTEDRLKALGVKPEALMCFSGRSILKKEGTCRVYPCPIIYEVPEYELGRTLEESFTKAVPLSHRACSGYCCRVTQSGSCTNAGAI